MKTIKIDPAIWLRGNGNSSLHRPTDGKECCFGIACIALGAEVKDINGIGDIRRVKNLPKELLNFIECIGKSSKLFVYEAYKANDDATSMPDQERIDKINAITEPHGLRFELRPVA